MSLYAHIALAAIGRLALMERDAKKAPTQTNQIDPPEPAQPCAEPESRQVRRAREREARKRATLTKEDRSNG